MAKSVRLGFSLWRAVRSEDISRRPHSLEDARGMIRRLTPTRVEQLHLAQYLIRQLEQDLSATPRPPCELAAALLYRRYYVLVRRRAAPRVLDAPCIRPLVEPGRVVADSAVGRRQQPPMSDHPEGPRPGTGDLPSTRPPSVPPTLPASTHHSTGDPPTQTAARDTYVEFRVVDQDGIALTGKYACKIGDTDPEVAKLAPRGSRREGLADGQPASLSVTRLAYAHCAGAGRQATPKPIPDDALRVPLEGRSFRAAPLTLGKVNTLVVTVPKAVVFTISTFGSDRALPCLGFEDEDTREGLTGSGTLSEIAMFARDNPEHRVVVLAHADTQASASHNDALTQARAATVAALIARKEPAFAALAGEHQGSGDLRRALRWVAHRVGLDTEPGVHGTPSDRRSAALASLREAFGDKSTGPPRDGDWGRIFRLVRQCIDEELGATPTGAPAIIATHAAGERWPRVAHVLDDNISARNRRVEVLFFGPEVDIPPPLSDPVAAEFYDADAAIFLDYVASRPRTEIALILRDWRGHSVRDAPFVITTATGALRRGRTDTDGRARLAEVPAGEYEIEWTEPDLLQARVWAAAAQHALGASDLAGALRSLMHPREFASDVARAFAELTGGPPDALAKELRTAAADTEFDSLTDLWIDRAAVGQRVEDPAGARWPMTFYDTSESD